MNPTYESNLPCNADAAIAYLIKCKCQSMKLTQVLYRNIIIFRSSAPVETADLPPLTVTRI